MERVLKKELLFGSVLLIASSNVALAYQFQDQYKTVINKKPYSVEVCTQGNGKTDLENFITGALIGGALNTEKNKGNQCVTETRYEEERVQVYSHTTVTFDYQGRQYTLNFKK